MSISPSLVSLLLSVNIIILFIFVSYGSVSTYDVSAFAALNDYEAKSDLVTFRPNSLQVPFLVRIFDDNVVEHTEQFGIRVISTDPQVNIIHGDILVSITDNDSK
jgi:hypothetical protein